MASTSPPTKSHPFIITLLPLHALALATSAVFALTIHSEYAALASFWTSCVAPPFGRLPTPVCFAIHFFQAAHATSRGRLEQAVIVSLLAGLATITAVESARVQRAAEGEKKPLLPAASRRWSLSREIVRNLPVAWLLYSLALGALAWQGIIIPAFLYQQQQRPGANITGRIKQKGDGEVEEIEDEAAPATLNILTIPLSIALGLLLPAAVMILEPTAPLPILLFLLFPLWTALTRHLISTRLLLPSRLTLLGHTHSHALPYALPILASALAHLALILSLLPSAAVDELPAPVAHNEALFLLELDHAAIFFAMLYWILLKAGWRGILAALAATVALGPGAGLCVGWLSGDGRRAEDRRTMTTTTTTTKPPPPLRRKGAKATSCFFEGLPT